MRCLESVLGCLLLVPLACTGLVFLEVHRNGLSSLFPLYTCACTNVRYIILGSDGVFEFISSKEAVQIVHDNVANGADNACQVLIEKSAVSWKANEGDYRDDVSSLVFCFSLLPCPALPCSHEVICCPLARCLLQITGIVAVLPILESVAPAAAPPGSPGPAAPGGGSKI